MISSKQMNIHVTTGVIYGKKVEITPFSSDCCRHIHFVTGLRYDVAVSILVASFCEQMAHFPWSSIQIKFYNTSQSLYHIPAILCSVKSHFELTFFLTFPLNLRSFLSLFHCSKFLSFYFAPYKFFFSMEHRNKRSKFKFLVNCQVIYPCGFLLEFSTSENKKLICYKVLYLSYMIPVFNIQIKSKFKYDK